MGFRSYHQPSLFPPLDAPEGFAFQPEIVSESEEEEFLDLIQTLSFGPFVMHGVEAKRRIVSFDLRADFPPQLAVLHRRAAALAGVTLTDFAHALISEYRPGAGIGWHCDSPQFGIVAGISLGAECRMRFQRKPEIRKPGSNRETWAVDLPPRSAYVLTGAARDEWQHSIPPLKELRYSITFRTLRLAECNSRQGYEAGAGPRP